ncbi:MAG: DUF4097 family beta strand repeat-containing protein [Bacteroidota bacterium]
METENKLNSLFELLRNEKPTTDIAEVKSWINDAAAGQTNTQSKPSYKIINLKTIFIMGTLTSMIISATLLFNHLNHQQVEKQHLSPKITQPNLKSVSKEVVNQKITGSENSEVVNNSNVTAINIANDHNNSFETPVAEVSNAITDAGTTTLASHESGNLEDPNNNTPIKESWHYAASKSKPSNPNREWIFNQDRTDVDTLFKGIKKLVFSSDVIEKINIKGSSRNDVGLQCHYKYEYKGLHINLNKHKARRALSYEIRDSVLYVNFEDKSTMNVMMGYSKTESYLNIEVPQGIAINVDASYGDIELNDLLGSNYQIHTSYGDCKVNNLKGKLDLNTSYGDINMNNLEGNMLIKSGYGDIELKTLSNGAYTIDTRYGDVRANEAKGQIAINAKSGDIKLKSVEGTLNLSSTYGDILGSGIDVVGPLNLSTSSGDIDFQVNDAASKFQFDLRSGFGDVSVNKSDLNIKSASTLQAGQGNTKITAKSGFGDVRIR